MKKTVILTGSGMKNKPFYDINLADMSFLEEVGLL